MKDNKSCCDFHGMPHGCRQGRDCPERGINPPGWGHPIVLLVVAWVLALVLGAVMLVRWLG